MPRCGRFENRARVSARARVVGVSTGVAQAIDPGRSIAATASRRARRIRATERAGAAFAQSVEGWTIGGREAFPAPGPAARIAPSDLWPRPSIVVVTPW